ncbi:SUMF1/EgtB/PvdO family nonheme iron enzyme [Cesiribacter sp. SM1]|uniref:SUMF1/EgtB/PvdO family nonheme iron enzyme n=1 Tax=Cesiribacter sp. SM1 TaxID=2861196 RepID=UPI001CD37860|nr:SUMF1/EgtB/PvdO family nonheme iron enzyme [Cesiribacter sp. SM1]
MPYSLKYLLVLVMLGSICTATSAQQPPLPSPPGTIQFMDTLYIDKTEVANVHWREFLFYVQRDSGEAVYREMLPDTSVWFQRNLAQPQTTSIKLTTEYFREKEYQLFPVVGINYEQAQAYARWRSVVVSELMNQPEQLAKLGIPAGKRVEVKYRLPTEEEWVAAAAGKLSKEKYPFGQKRYLKKGGNSLNPEQAYKQLDEPRPSFSSFRKDIVKARIPQFQVVAELPYDFYLAPEYPKAITDGPSNKQGMINMIGNVAEMTATPGIAKGGSFMHKLEDSKISEKQAYEQATPWLGVRYVATIRVVDPEMPVIQESDGVSDF